MAFQIDVISMGGEISTTKANDGWSVWDFKRAVAKTSGAQPNKMRLITLSGKELLDDKPLCDFCSPDERPEQLMLVRTPKTQEELDWLERWFEVTPSWLQRWTEEVMDTDDFSQLRRLAALKERCPLHMRCNCLLAKSSPPPRGSAEPVPTRPALTTGKEVLSLMRRVPYKLNSSGCMVSLCEVIDGEDTRRHTATLEAVLEAIEQEPTTMVSQVDLQLAYTAVGKFPGIYSCLPEAYKAQRLILHEALKCDSELRAEFLQTAGKSAIRKWQWLDDSADRPRRKRR